MCGVCLFDVCVFLSGGVISDPLIDLVDGIRLKTDCFLQRSMRVVNSTVNPVTNNSVSK